MPTFNQLVRKGRQVLATKSTAPALLKSYNSQKKQYSDLNSPQKRGVCTAVRWAYAQCQHWRADCKMARHLHS